MKQYFLKASGVAALALMLHSKTIAQDTPPPPPPVVATPGEVHDEADDREEIIIRKKSNKDTKITVEIKDGNILINGKPANEYKDDNLSITKIKRIHNGDSFSFSSSGDDDIRVSPFRGGTSFYGDDFAKRANVAFLGVTTDDADGGGAEITGITENSGAQKAGLKRGDVITKINDIKVDGQEDVTEAIHKFKPADKITVTFKRDGKEEKLTATLGKSGGMNFSGSLDMSMPQLEKMKEFSNMDRLYAPRAYSYSYSSNTKPRLGIRAQETEDGKGVKVLDVAEESPADKAGIKEGDIIMQFDGKPVNSAEALVNLAKENKDKYSYKINLTRDGKAQEIEVKIPKKLKTANL